MDRDRSRLYVAPPGTDPSSPDGWQPIEGVQRVTFEGQPVGHVVDTTPRLDGSVTVSVRFNADAFGQAILAAAKAARRLRKALRRAGYRSSESRAASARRRRTATALRARDRRAARRNRRNARGGR